MILEHDNYRSFLKAKLAERISANPAYSLRAFAKQLGMAPSTLSEVLSLKKNISHEVALKIAKCLKLSEKEKDYFISLVQFESAKSMELKAEIQNKLSKLNIRNTPNDLNLDIFRMISDWHHVAILEIFTIPKIKTSAERIAQFLGITKFEVETAIERLLRLELLESSDDGSLKKTKDNLLAQSPKPNAALRAFHKQMLQKAQVSLEAQTPAQKSIGSETFAFDPADLDKANEIIEECFNKIVDLSKKSKKKNDIYHLGIQLFRLNKEKEKL